MSRPLRSGCLWWKQDSCRVSPQGWCRPRRHHHDRSSKLPHLGQPAGWPFFLLVEDRESSRQASESAKENQNPNRESEPRTRLTMRRNRQLPSRGDLFLLFFPFFLSALGVLCESHSFS